MTRPMMLAALLALGGCGGGDASATANGDDGAGASTSGGADGAGGSEGAGAGGERGGEGDAPALGNQRAAGHNFSVPVPVGYERVTRGIVADMMREDVLEPGGVILMADATDVAGARPGSIVVSPLAANISSDAVTDAFCAQIAEVVAQQQEATVDRVGMVELPWGRTCQWELVKSSEEGRRRIGTMFAANAEDWVVTCNLDERDDVARSACTEVLSGWAFDP